MQSSDRSNPNLNDDLPPRLRSPQKTDAFAIHQLIGQCPPLDLNSVYAYLLLTEHFSRTCILAEYQGRVVGFVSAYIPPEKPDVLFVWQVAVHSVARGHSLGTKMLSALLKRLGRQCPAYIETTVGPDNKASRSMFGRLAQGLLAPVQESPLFETTLFGPGAHEEERLIRIGPIQQSH